MGPSAAKKDTRADISFRAERYFRNTPSPCFVPPTSIMPLSTTMPPDKQELECNVEGQGVNALGGSLPPLNQGSKLVEDREKSTPRDAI